jgi:maltose O-acetyltransferase
MDSYYWKSRLDLFGKNAKIYSTAKIYAPSKVRIGANSVVNDFVHIWGAGGVVIGENSMIASHTVITSQSHSINALATGELYRDTNELAPVCIGDNVWIASNVSILPGVSIGDGAVVGAGSVVTRDIPARTLAVGVPALLKRKLGGDDS